VSKRRGGDPDRESTFAEAMRDVKPLAGREKVRPPPSPKASAPPRTAPPAAGEPVRFEIESAGERVSGLAPGVDRRHLRRLRSGKVPVERRVDLHGLVSHEAREAVRDALLEAAAAGARCVLVVHGRGSHSPGEPVLKAALPEWLAEPPLGARVLAFATAPPRDGGAGATCVLLRRTRKRDAG